MTNMTNEEKLEKMLQAMERSRTRFNSSFENSLKVVKEKLQSKSKSLTLLAESFYHIPTVGGKSTRFFYRLDSGEIVSSNEDDKPIEMCGSNERNRFISEILGQWELVEKEIDNDIEKKLERDIKACEKKLNEYTKGLLAMGAQVDDLSDLYVEKNELEAILD